MKILNSPPERQTNNLMTGMAFILTSAFFFACMSLGIRLLKGTVSPALLVFMRAFFQVLVLSWGSRQFLPTRKNWKEKLSLHFVRGAFGTISMFFMYIAMQHLPIAIASLLTMTSVLWAAFISWAFLKERLSPRQWAYSAVVLAGISIAILSESGLGLGTLNLSLVGVGAGLFAGFFAGSAYSVLRSMRSRAGTREIVFFFGITGMLLSFPLAFWKLQLPTQLSDWLLVLYVAICATVAQLFMTEGYKHTPTTIAGLVNLQQITFTVILGAFFLNEIPPNLFFVGALFVLIGLRGILIASKEQHGPSKNA